MKKNILDFAATYNWVEKALEPYCEDYKWFRPSTGCGGCDIEYLYKLKQNLYQLQYKSVDELIAFSSGNAVTSIPEDAPEVRECLEAIKTLMGDAFLTNIESFKDKLISFMLDYYTRCYEKRTATNILEFILFNKSSLIVSNIKNMDTKTYKEIFEFRQSIIQIKDYIERNSSSE